MTDDLFYGLLFLLIGIVGILISVRMENNKDDMFLSKPVSFSVSIMMLIGGVFILLRMLFST